SGVCSTDILPILPGPDLDRGYLFHYLSQPTVIALAASQATGANLPRLSFKALERLEIPLPPLDEQRRIAAILDQADTVRVRRRRVLSELDKIVESIFHSMFGSFSGKFLTVEEVAAPEKGSIRTGPFGSQLLHGEFV